MKINIRIDGENEQHIRFTIFQDGGNCGQLCMNTKDVDLFLDCLCESKYFEAKVTNSVA